VEKYRNPRVTEGESIFLHQLHKMFISSYGSSQITERLCICVLDVSILHLSKILIFDLHAGKGTRHF
jgi:hypothetical protein